MDIKHAQQALWESHQTGHYYPDEWHNRLTVDQAYAIQLDILRRKKDAGAKHTGWKVGLTADAVRGIYDVSEPVFGYLLAEGYCQSGQVFKFADLHPPLMETEILVTLGSSVVGPKATIADARASVASIAPAFEVPERRGGGLELDFSLGLVDNVSQRAYVVGDAIAFDESFEFADVVMTLSRNGQQQAKLTGGDVMDHQLQTIAWLANTLHRFGWQLEAGDSIMTGSFTKPAPVTTGDTYEAQFSGVGVVSMSFTE